MVPPVAVAIMVTIVSMVVIIWVAVIRIVIWIIGRRSYTEADKRHLDRNLRLSRLRARRHDKAERRARRYRRVLQPGTDPSTHSNLPSARPHRDVNTCSARKFRQGHTHRWKTAPHQFPPHGICTSVAQTEGTENTDAHQHPR